MTNAMPYTMLGDPEAADMAVLTSTLSQRGEFFWRTEMVDSVWLLKTKNRWHNYQKKGYVSTPGQINIIHKLKQLNSYIYIYLHIYTNYDICIHTLEPSIYIYINIHIIYIYILFFSPQLLMASLYLGSWHVATFPQTCVKCV